MTLRVETYESLSAVGRATWLGLEEKALGASVFQSWWWLNAWWPIWGEGQALVIAVFEHDQAVGLGAFMITPRGRLAFMGEEHADYGNVLLSDDRPDVAGALVAALYAKRGLWRRLDLKDVPVGCPLAQALTLHSGLQGPVVACPRVQFSQRPLKTLLAKESLRRHERKVAQLGTVEFLHLDSAEEITPWLPRFFAQHIQRWAPTPTPSLFVRPRNCELYSELAQTAEPGGPLLFTVVQAGGEPVAMHFGFRSQNDVIWYKPTFDLKHAATGAGEVLLMELLRRADKEGAQGLDFSRGDEAFKLRFASEIRAVADFEDWPGPLRRSLTQATRAARALTVKGLTTLGLKPLIRRWVG